MASALPPTWINISPRLLGPERDCVSSALSDIWRAGGKPVGRDPPHSLGETVGDRSSPVCCPPLTFSPLLCSLSSSSTHPFFDHDSSLFLLLLIPSIFMSLTDQQYREVTMRWKLHLWSDTTNTERLSLPSSLPPYGYGRLTAIDFWLLGSPNLRKHAHFAEAQNAYSYNSVSCTLTTKL